MKTFDWTMFNRTIVIVFFLKFLEALVGEVAGGLHMDIARSFLNPALYIVGGYVLAKQGEKMARSFLEKRNGT